MLALNRQQEILYFINKNKVATVVELAEKFNVHEATIRRDLSLLENRALIERTHGGVVKKEEVFTEPSFQERQTINSEDKRKIGEYTEKFINDGDNIILDSGTTTAYIARVISKKRNITVTTNDVNIATRLRHSHQNKTIVTGGVLFPDSYMLNGYLTDEAFNNLFVHTAFIGTPAFHPEVGLSHFDDYLVSAKKAMIRSARKIVVVADHTKFGKIAHYKVAEIKEIDALITTKHIDQNIKKMLKDAGVETYIV